jgi:hypothetical protein
VCELWSNTSDLVLFGAAALVPEPVPGPVIAVAPDTLMDPPLVGPRYMPACQELPWRRVAKMGRSRCPRAVGLVVLCAQVPFALRIGENLLGHAHRGCVPVLKCLPFEFSHLLASVTVC